MPEDKMVTRHLTHIALILATVGILSACGASRPVAYYVLDIEPPQDAPPAAKFPVALAVGRIMTTHLYRDDRLVYGSGPVELGTYEYERWAESPADMVQDMLIAYLRGSGQYRSVSRLTSTVRADYIVRGRLLGLYEVDKPKMAARFSMEIELFDPKSSMTIWTSSYSHDDGIEGKKIDNVVEALDKDVRNGMQQLTADLGQYFATRPQQSSPGPQSP
jgi:ABC-type uncharacterized transport system auxiliary subunit